MGKARCGTLSSRQHRILRRILACGTGELGHHIYRCEQCHQVHAVAHSCRDRHCPRCQAREANKWLEKQRESLLPVPYFHVVFTLPHQLNGLISQNPTKCLSLLFDAASSTMLSFGRNNLGVQLGITTVLHTWGQTLSQHYHLHMIVTGGGLSLSGDEWVGVEKPNWLFSTRALARVYQARYLEGLRKLFDTGKLEFHGKLESWSEPAHFTRQLRTRSRQKWNVYTKSPFGGPEQVLRYLSLYTHRVAISAGRVLKLDHDAGSVTFRYRNYRKPKSPWEPMTLQAGEFTRRFSNHILPARFCKIRHYGIQSTRNRKIKIALCRYYLKGKEDLFGADVESGLGNTTDDRAREEDAAVQAVIANELACPHCGSLKLKLLRVTGCDGGIDCSASRGPPDP